METKTGGDITQLLQRAQGGEKAAHDALLAAVYDELKRLSRAQRRQAHDHTLGTTALVHEVYLKLVGKEELSWPDRHRFFAYAARAMRSILVDRARRHMAEKRSADLDRVPLTDAYEQPLPNSFVDLLSLHDVLGTIERIDPNIADIIELHVFGGLEFADIAPCLGLSERTVYRRWEKGRALIQMLLDERDGR